MLEKLEAIDILFPNKQEFNIINNLLIFGCSNLWCHKDKSLLSEALNEEKKVETNEKIKEEKEACRVTNSKIVVCCSAPSRLASIWNNHHGKTK